MFAENQFRKERERQPEKFADGPNTPKQFAVG